MSKKSFIEGGVSRLLGCCIAATLVFACAFSSAAQQADHLTGIKKLKRERGELSLVCLFDSTQVSNGAICELSLVIQPARDGRPGRAAKPWKISMKTAVRPFQEHDGAGILAAHFVRANLFDFDSALSYAGTLTIRNGEKTGVWKIDSGAADFLDGRKSPGDSTFSILKKRTTGLHDLTTRDSSAKASSSLTVQFAEVESDKGVIRVVVYEKEGYGDKLKRDENKELFTMIVKAREGTTAVTVRSLPFGEYVILAFHDRDENNEQRSSVFRFEKAGFSRDARPQISEELPPKWTEAKFSVNRKFQTHRIKLKGWFDLLRTKSK